MVLPEYRTVRKDSGMDRLEIEMPEAQPINKCSLQSTEYLIDLLEMAGASSIPGRGVK
jgi:hypothetical protein